MQKDGAKLPFQLHSPAHNTAENDLWFDDYLGDYKNWPAQPFAESDQLLSIPLAAFPSLHAQQNTASGTPRASVLGYADRSTEENNEDSSQRLRLDPAPVTYDFIPREASEFMLASTASTSSASGARDQSTYTLGHWQPPDSVQSTTSELSPGFWVLDHCGPLEQLDVHSDAHRPHDEACLRTADDLTLLRPQSSSLIDLDYRHFDNGNRPSERVVVAPQPDQGSSLADTPAGRRVRLPKITGGYPCSKSDCSKVFDRAGDRAKHQRTHQPRDSYAHQYSSCERRFMYAKDLKRHQTVHDCEAVKASGRRQ